MTEGEIVERGLVVTPQAPGVQALAALSDADFERNLLAIRQGQQRIARMQRELLIPGVDYGNVPGVDKPSLGKPGAEKFCIAYGLAARIEQHLVTGDNVTGPLITYDATCHLHLGTFDGPVVGVGHGTCNSWESKYRYRNAERSCPTCGQATIIAGKAEYGGGWLCFRKRGGCGAKFGAEDPRITGQQVGREDNPEPWDLANTIMKMAEKRAHVDATLRTTAASGIFTQDLEDNVGMPGVTPEPAPAAARPAAKPAQRASNVPPPLTDAEIAAMGNGMPPRPAPSPAAATDADEIMGEFTAAPVGLSASALASLARQAGRTKGQLALAIGALGQPVPAPTEVTAVVTAMTDDERGRLADELNLDWRTPGQSA